MALTRLGKKAQENKDKDLEVILELYKAYHDSCCVFDEHRKQCYLAALSHVADRLGHDLKDIHLKWKEYRKMLCESLGNQLSSPPSARKAP